jgi:hypothetical protein
MKALLAGLRGGNMARVRALAGRRAKPRFALGQIVREPFGDIGAIDAIYADLEAAEDLGIVGNRKEWLRAQERRPVTKATETWYSVVLSEGACLVGEHDLRRVDAPRARKPRRRR